MDSVFVDSDLGRNTEFIAEYTGSDINIILVSPAGLMYDIGDATHDTSFNVYRFMFPGLNEV